MIKLPDSVFKPYAGQLTYVLFFEKGMSTTTTWFYEIKVPEGQKAFSKTKPIQSSDFEPCRNWWGGPKREGRVETENAWQVTRQEIEARNFDLDFQNPNQKRLDGLTVTEVNNLIKEEMELSEGLLAELKSFVSTTLLSKDFKLESEEVIDSLLTVASAGGSFIKHLKNIAVKGLLFDENPTHAQHEDILAKLESGEVKPSPFNKKWVRGSLNAFIELRYGSNLPAEKRSGGVVPVYGSNGITGYHSTPLISDPCIVVGRKGSVGALNLCDVPSWTTDVAFYVISPSYLDINYLYHLLGTLGLENMNRGVKPGLSRKLAYSVVIDIPPLSEQRAILANILLVENLVKKIEESGAKLKNYRMVKQEAIFEEFYASLNLENEVEGLSG